MAELMMQLACYSCAQHFQRGCIAVITIVVQQCDAMHASARLSHMPHLQVGRTVMRQGEQQGDPWLVLLHCWVFNATGAPVSRP